MLIDNDFQQAALATGFGGALIIIRQSALNCQCVKPGCSKTIASKIFDGLRGGAKAVLLGLKAESIFQCGFAAVSKERIAGDIGETM